MRTVLKPVGTLPLDAVEERLLDARRTYKLNFGYAALSSLPVTFLEMVKRFNPHITELDLSRLGGPAAGTPGLLGFPSLRA
ncbi:hypothetical protein V8C86DRAFT_3101347 [Haematococcus lacustris]